MEEGGGGSGLGDSMQFITYDGAENGYCTTKHELKNPSNGCRKNPAWRKAHGYPEEEGITGKGAACTVAGAVGGEVGGFPGAIIAGGVCVLLW